jgi:hypothetical protein
MLQGPTPCFNNGATNRVACSTCSTDDAARVFTDVAPARASSDKRTVVFWSTDTST